MALYPGAAHRLISHQNARKGNLHYRINLHTAVSNAASLHGYFSGPTRPCSHFYVAEDGTVEQYIDTANHSNADLSGNDATISIETWDGYGKTWGIAGLPGAVPAWNEAQLAALVKLIAWLMREHGIPRVLARSSVPGENRGLSWHRLGVPSRPAHQAGYLQPGGVRFSNAVGKSCPGDARIAQIPGILEAVKAELGEVDDRVPSNPLPPAPGPGPRRLTPPLDEDGSRGRATIAGWQQVMGTVADGVISKPSALIKADQAYLNRAVGPGHLQNLIGRPALDVDGYEGAQTITARQFLLKNRVDPTLELTGRLNKPTVRAHQKALNRAAVGSGSY